MLYKFRERKKEEKCCIRCGMSEKDVRQSGIGCSVWGTDYKKHKYETMSYQLSPLEQYRAKKIEEFDKHRFDFVGDISFLKVKELLSQTIDELGKLPNKSDLNQIVQDSQGSICPSREEIAEEIGWNACIAEAERMRDLSIKGKR